MIIGHLGEIFYDDSLYEWKRLLVMKYVGKCTLGVCGARSNTDEWRKVLPVLQFAPIIYP